MIEGVKLSEASDAINMNDMKPYDIGTVVSAGDYNGQIVMRTARGGNSEVMNISNPGADKCWNNSTLMVELLKSGTKVIMVVK